MVKAWNKNQLREIRGTLGRFLAILGIVALGVGFFAGLKVTQPSMLLTGSEYAEATALYDLRLISTLGLTEEDVAYFKAMPGVSAAEGANSVDLTAKKGDREYTLKALSLSSKINKPSLTAGRMPRKPFECLADDRRFSESDIGETLTVTCLSRDGALSETELTIVGLAGSPLYLNISRGTTAIGGGSLDGFLFVRRECFPSEYFTEIYLRLKNVDRTLYSDLYDQQLEELEPAFREALELRAQHRYDSIIEDANSLLDSARQRYEEGLAEYQTGRAEAQAQLADALQALTDGAAQIESNRLELQKAEKELADAQAKLDQGRKEYADGVAELAAKQAEAQQQLADAQAQIDANRALLEEGLAQAGEALDAYRRLLDTRQELTDTLARLEPGSWLYRSTELLLQTTEQAIARIEESEEFGQLQQLMEAQAQLEEAQATLDAQKETAQAEFAAAQEKLDAAAQEIADGEAELRSGREKIASGKEALRQAELDLASGQAEYDDAYARAQEGFAQAEAELAEGKKAIDEAELEIEKLEHPNVFLLDRESNPGYLSFKSDSGIVDGIAKVFPLFFFLVAAFVCVTTMTRMVDEQRTQIGTLKALGYSDSQISLKYMAYSGSAALVGAVLGFALGTRVFPWVIWKCYDILYGFAPLSFSFSLPMALVSLAAALVCSVGATWAACRTELRRFPAQLMRPKAPKAGKRILLERVPILWNRFSFLYKVSIRNIVRYKKRLAMMLVGIGGCTALIVTGCGIKDSIANIAQVQFDEITHYDVSVTFSVPMSDARQQEFRETYSDMRECVFLGNFAYETAHSGGISTLYVIATDDENLTNTVSLHHDGTPVPFPREGTVIDSALANLLGVGIGDSISIRVSDTKTVDVPVVGLFDNHLYHYAIMSGRTYEQYFGQECEYQTAYISTDSDPYDLGKRIADNSLAGSVSVMDALRITVDNMMKSLNAMVFVVIGSACALAFIVIYNLTNITINERVREIATIKVLGFYPKETESYVSREIMILTVLGALIGLPLGTALNSFVMSQIAIDMVSFRVQIFPLSYLLAFVITIGMELVTSLLLRGKIEKINMAESLKSVE